MHCSGDVNGTQMQKHDRISIFMIKTHSLWNISAGAFVPFASLITKQTCFPFSEHDL